MYKTNAESVQKTGKACKCFNDVALPQPTCFNVANAIANGKAHRKCRYSDMW